MKAVIDRFEGEFAVILFGEKEIKANFPRQLLPSGAKEGTWLKIDLELDQDATKQQEEKIRGLLDKLKRKGKD